MAYVREAVYADCLDLAPRLRPEDVAEVWASSRSTPLEALTAGLEPGCRCYTVVNDEGVIVAMGGVGPIPGTDAGGPWLLGSNDIEKIQMWFLRNSKKYIDSLHDEYKVLWNAADIRNTVHLRWLRWCGFEFLSTYKCNETEFVQFMKIKE